jgi:hypothetical protein
MHHKKKEAQKIEIKQVKSSLRQWGPGEEVIKCRSSKILEMFLGILLASLWGRKKIGLECTVNGESMWMRVQPTLAGLPTFCPMTFHLFASYSLIASRSFMDCAKLVGRLEECAISSYNHKGVIPHLRQIQRNAYPELKCQRHRYRGKSVGVLCIIIPCTSASSHCLQSA